MLARYVPICMYVKYVHHCRKCIGPATKPQLFMFITLPLTFCYILSGIFLVSSAVMVRRTIVKNKKTVTRNATMNMVDLYKRLLFYAFGVLLTLSLLVIAGFAFWLKHDEMREGMRVWIICEIENYYGRNKDCESLRTGHQKISPFYFMSWNFACFIAICAQIILSFHGKARQRASTYIKQKTIKIGAVVRNSKLDIMTGVDSPVHSPQTSTDVETVSTNPSSGYEDGGVPMTQIKEEVVEEELPDGPEYQKVTSASRISINKQLSQVNIVEA